MKDRRQLALEIADHGGWEEFHQRRHEYEMYDYHKGVRLKLEREYRTAYRQPSVSCQGAVP